MNKILTVSFEETFDPLKDVIERCAFNYISGCNETLDDVVQDMMVKVLENWDELKSLPVNRLKDFVYIATRNYMINNIRRTQRKRIYHNHFMKTQTGLSWHDDILVQEGINVYKEAVNLLTPVQKEVFLYYQQGEVCRLELSKALQKSEHTIRNQLNSANKVIRRYLNKKFHLNICEDGRKKIFRLADLN